MKKFVLLILLSCLSFILYGCTNPEETNEPDLLGSANETVEVGSSYTDPGLNYEYDERLTITGEVDTSTLGTYTIAYDVELSESRTVTLTRTVEVVDTTAPTITLTDGDMTINAGDSFSDPGYQANDNYDGDISSEVVVAGSVDSQTPGVYVLTYNVSDSSDNSASTVNRTVTVVANTTNQPPVISLNGEAMISITVNDPYSDQGATASDPEDGDLTSDIIVTGSVDTSTAGTYTLTYNVTDSQGASATTVTRTVVVEEVAVNEAPTISLIGGSTITTSVNDSYTDQGATASDPEDGDISSDIIMTGSVDTSSAGTYTLTYDVSDSHGLAANTVTRTVVVEDVVVNQPPTITLVGDDLVSIYVDDTFSDQGATASDPEDGDISSDIIMTGSVDTSTSGTYTITYEVTDSQGLSATQVTRTVQVVELVVSGYQTIYIAKDLTVDWSSLLTNLGYDQTNVSIDSSSVGSHIVTLDNQTLTVIVFDSNDVGFTIVPGSVLLLESNYNWAQYHFRLSLPAFSALNLSTVGGGLTYMRVEDMSTIHPIIEPMTQNYNSSNALYLDEGNYGFMVETYGATQEVLQIYIETTGLVSSSNMVEISEGLTSINTKQLTQVSTLNVAIEGQKEMMMYTYRPFMVEITDSLGQTIIKQEAVSDGYDYHFNLHQHFAVGDYQVSLEFLDYPTPINIFYTLDSFSNYAYTESIPINLNIIEDLQVLMSRDWYHIDIPSDGYYQFDVLFASHHLYDFTIYDELLHEVSYGQNYEYLDAGRYYIQFPHYAGEVAFKVHESYHVISANNDAQSASTLLFDTVYPTYFDESQDEKWFTFTLATSEIIRLSLVDLYYGHDPLLTIYDDGLTVISEEFTSFYKLLQPGTYYVKAMGANKSATAMIIEALDVPIITATDTNPVPMVLGEEIHSYIDSTQTHTFNFTLDQTKTLEFIYRGFTRMDVVISGPNNFLLETTAYSGDNGVLDLSEGTYTLQVTASYGSNIYQLTARTMPDVNAESPFSLDINTAGYLDPDMPGGFLVDDGDISVFVQLQVVDAAVLYTYPENVNYVKVYDQNQLLIEEGTPWLMFPMALSAGDYYLELITYDEGYLGFHELTFKPLHDYGSLVDSLTRINSLYGIRGFNPTGDTVDIMTFTIETDRYMTFEGYDLIDYQIFDHNWVAVSPIMRSYEREIIHFISGDYYLVVNGESSFYEIEAYNVTDQLLGEAFTSATQIYQNEPSKTMLKDNFTDGYYTFDVVGDTYLSFDYDTYKYLIEIYDHTFSPYTDPLFTSGTYYIHLISIKDCMGPCPLEFTEMTVENINRKVIDNTMQTAKESEISEVFYGEIVNQNHQAWFSFDVEETALVRFSIYDPYATFTLYESNGTMIDTLKTQYYDLAISTYYILVEGQPGEYEYKITFAPYTVISDVEDHALEVDLDEGLDFSLQSIIHSTSDIDWFKVTLTEQVFYDVYVPSYNYANVVVYDSSGSVVSQFSDDTYLDLSPDTYTFKVTRGSIGHYSLTFTNRNEYLEGSSFQTAREIELGPQINAYFMISPSSLYYTFTIDEAASVILYNNGYSSDTLTLYQDDLSTVVTDYDLTAGTYYVEFHSEYSIGYRSFRISIQQEDIVNEGTLDNTIDTPLVLTDQFFTLHQTVDDYTDQDFFTITLTEETVYIIDEINYTGADIYIYEASDLTNPIGGYDTFNHNIIALDAGEYIIEVTATYGTYQFAFKELIYTDYPSTKLDAGDLFIHQQLNSYLNGINDQDVFTLTLANDAVLSFDTFSQVEFQIYTMDDFLVSTSSNSYYHELTAGQYYLVITNTVDAFTGYRVKIINHIDDAFGTDHTVALTYPVYDTINYLEGYLSESSLGYLKFEFTDPTEMIFNCNNCRLLDDSLTEVTTSPYPAGTYYLELTSTNAGLYSISYMRIDQLLYDQTTPVALTVGTYVYGYQKSTSDVDVFTIQTTEDQYLSFHFVDASYISIMIKDDTDHIVYNQSDYTYNLENIPFMANANTTYTIEITNIMSAYRFILWPRPFIDVGDTPVTAKTITLDSTPTMIDGHIYDYLDEDWYAFTTDTSTEYTITTTFATFDVYESDGQTSYTASVYTPGTYYIKVTYSSQSDYQLTIQTP